jgi:hypothetical protein
VNKKRIIATRNKKKQKNVGKKTLTAGDAAQQRLKVTIGLSKDVPHDLKSHFFPAAWFPCSS